jgi:pyruvate/2-oxoglutarate dehydrogenase complex dihydrolipoamide dehydrogenase (E3) component
VAETIRCDICVIGAGSAGLSVAAGAAQMGADTVLIEKGRMGGDCLNTGCVPSKSLLAAAKAARSVREAGRFGIRAGEPGIDFAAVHAHVHGVIAAIAPHDSEERFAGLGARILRAAARFADPRTVVAGGTAVRARRFVLATGSRAAVPPIPGIETVPYMTNETVFERTSAPGHLIVLGGGPVGIEMAQAHRRLGARVTVVEAGLVLSREDPELVEVVRRQLAGEGIDLRERARVSRIAAGAGGTGGVALELEGGERIEGSDLLVATGRRPGLDGLGLEEAGIEHTPKGVTTDARLRTTNRRVFACGDVAGGPQFTHAAGYQAGIVLRNALFRLPAKVDYSALPRVTYTDPELAQVGATEEEARGRAGGVGVLRWPFAENDRARADGVTDGFVKVVTGPGGRILGASIVGAHAGELIQVWALAISHGLKVGAVASMIAPYPTLGEASKRAAGAFYTPTLFGPRTRRLVRLLSRFG